MKDLLEDFTDTLWSAFTVTCRAIFSAFILGASLGVAYHTFIFLWGLGQ